MEQMKEYEYVDLGLPSGLKWAKCNIGAETETDYGDYFMWGEVTPNTDEEYSWASYKYCNGSYNTLTKYCRKKNYGAVDNKLALDTEDDTAIQIMGGDWRMPTKDDFQELLDNTTNEWVTDYNGTGVNGRKFTSKTNGNSIFIPASGCRWGNSFHYQGEDCAIWSSSLNALSNDNAWCLSSSSYYINVNYDYRFGGFVIRGVMD